MTRPTRFVRDLWLRACEVRDLRDQVVTLTTERDQLRRDLVDARADASTMRDLLGTHLWLGPGPCPICRAMHPSGGAA